MTELFGKVGTPESGKTTYHEDGSVTFLDGHTGHWFRTKNPDSLVICGSGVPDGERLLIDRHLRDAKKRAEDAQKRAEQAPIRTSQNPPEDVVDGQLRVWHIPNLPDRKPSYLVYVRDVNEAIRMLDVLAFYDLHLGDRLISSNAQGLEVFEDGEWNEWHNNDDLDIEDVRNQENAA